MLEFDLANELARITLLPITDFERALLHLQDSPLLIRLLADVLSSPLRDEQKQMAAVGINWTITHRLQADRSQWPALWEEYLSHVLRHREMELVEWRHLVMSGKALQRLMEEFEGELCAILNPLFRQLPFKSKALIYDSFLYVETTPATRLVFLRETLEDLLADALNFIAAHHDAHRLDRDSSRLERAIVKDLAELLGSFAAYSEGPIYDVMVKISLNTDLFLLIVEELLFDPARTNHTSILKEDFSLERMRELVLVCGEEEVNELKAKAFSIYSHMLCQYDLKSGIEEFDQFKLLLFMENLTPIVVDKLVQLAARREGGREGDGEGEDAVVVALLAFLRRSCRFNFMLQTFETHLERIFYQLCLPFLQTSPQQRELFAAQDAEFINISEQLFESHENQTPTVKNAAGNFLEQLSQTIQGSLLFMVENSIQTIRGQLLQEHFPQVDDAVQQHRYRPSVDIALIVLSLFSSHYLHRQDLYVLIKDKLLSLQQLLHLQGIDKARLLIFLAYNYENLYHGDPQEGSRFLLLADGGLDEGGCVSGCALMLFENCLKVGFGDDIWQNFTARLADTKLASVFRLILQILEKMLDSLPVQKVEELIGKVMGRLVGEFRRCEGEAKAGQAIRGNEYLLLCLDIICKIAENEQYLKEEPSVVLTLWPVFDLFQFSERIEFEDDILAIFNRVLAVERQITHEHFRFVPHFSKIYEKQNGFGELLNTVTLLLTRGREYLLTEESGRADLQELANFVKCCYGVMKNEDTLKHVLVFFHYIYLEYSALLPFDQHLHDTLLEVYAEQKAIMRAETKAAIINFLLIGHCRYGNCDLSPIAQNQIKIFHGYQAKLFALDLRLAIEKDYQGGRLLTHLRCSIRLLHYIRELILKQDPDRHGYYQPAFPELTAIDPFNEICISLNFVKRNLEPRRYDTILEELNSEISMGEIKDLLSRRIIEKSMRTIKRVRQP